MCGLLIAEDELIERMVLKKTLEKKLGDQLTVYEAQNGREAVELMRREDISIAILDIAMPVMNGIEAAERIRKENSWCSLIFLTAYDRFEYAKKAVSVRAMEYLLKPYSQMEVLAVVQEAIHLAGDAGRAVKWEERPRTETKDEGEVNRLTLLVSMVEEYIKQNYMKDISMGDAARAVGYSEPYFCTMFKQQYGQNFTAYLAEYRINEARKLLAQPNVSIREAGERTGYPDSNYFTKVFRRLTGKNPSEYRKELFQELNI